MPTLDWLNRADAFTLANKVPYRLLEQVSIHGTTVPAQTGNLPIQGDKRRAGGNVLTRNVLAALLNQHAKLATANTSLVVYGESVRVGP